MGDQESKPALPASTPEPARSNAVDGRDLSEADLEKVSGGTGAQPLTNLQQLKHDVEKAIVSNLRA